MENKEEENGRGRKEWKNEEEEWSKRERREKRRGKRERAEERGWKRAAGKEQEDGRKRKWNSVSV